MYNPKWRSKLVRALMFQWQCFNDGSSREKNQIWKKGGACEVTIKVVNSYWATKAQKNCIAYQMRRKQRTCILVSRIKNPWLKHFFFFLFCPIMWQYISIHILDKSEKQAKRTRLTCGGSKPQPLHPPSQSTFCPWPWWQKQNTLKHF